MKYSIDTTIEKIEYMEIWESQEGTFVKLDHGNSRYLHTLGTEQPEYYTTPEPGTPVKRLGYVKTEVDWSTETFKNTKIRYPNEQAGDFLDSPKF